KAGSTPEGYVRSLFRDLAGRDPTPAEMNYWARRAWYEPRSDIAYALLARYPQTGSAPASAPTYDYDYRPPLYRYYPPKETLVGGRQKASGSARKVARQRTQSGRRPCRSAPQLRTGASAGPAQRAHRSRPAPCPPHPVASSGSRCRLFIAVSSTPIRAPG